METEKASHLETKFNSEVLQVNPDTPRKTRGSGLSLRNGLRTNMSTLMWQLRLGDLQAALAVEKSGHQVALHNLELLRAQLREVEQVSNQEKEKSVGLEINVQRWDAKHGIIFFPF